MVKGLGRLAGARRSRVVQTKPVIPGLAPGMTDVAGRVQSVWSSISASGPFFLIDSMAFLAEAFEL